MVNKLVKISKTKNILDISQSEHKTYLRRPLKINTYIRVTMTYLALYYELLSFTT